MGFGTESLFGSDRLVVTVWIVVVLGVVVVEGFTLIGVESMVVVVAEFDGSVEVLVVFNGSQSSN